MVEFEDQDRKYVPVDKIDGIINQHLPLFNMWELAYYGNIAIVHADGPKTIEKKQKKITKLIQSKLN